MLSALVVNKSSRIPGGGFFDLAENMGLFDGGDRKSFWHDELNRVYAYWQGSPTPNP